MTRSTTAISLVLIGGVLALGYYGCEHHSDDNDPNAPHHGHSYGGGHYVGRPFGGYSGGWGSSGGRAASPGVSPRGGFGSIGHAAAGS